MVFIKVHFVIFYFLGLIPFSYKKNANIVDKKKFGPDTITLVPTEIHTCYSLVLIIIIVIGNSIQIPLFIKERYSGDGNELTETLSLAISVSGNGVLIIMLLLYIVQRQKIIKLGNQLLDLDVAMKKLHNIYKLESDKMELILICYINTIPCVIIALFTLFIEASFIRATCMYTFHTIVFNYFVMQYAIVLTLIEKKLKCCNDAFLRMKKSIELQFRVYNTQKNTLEKTSIIEIFALKRCHTILCKMCSDIADFYSFGFLFIIPYSIVCVILNIYDLLTPFLKIYPTDDVIVRRIGNIAWITARLFPILTTAICATKVSKQIKRTSSVIQEILFECFMSPEIKNELKIFSLELLHKNFQFTAYNVIPVDCTVLRTVFGAIATYLIIFIQFQSDDM
ncbi:putative gustatory receptor 28a [Cotesia glomerata]|uniref:Gustatory receptor n=1 Tax=Cotesia glomerata TaxID=32391 RepID=A0AAV7IQB0_COTGL|nr:putative gustatory receptor 28a [Cotesia glomerata]KAH0554825.1 hypothetical protein KQX54_012920 [Cotesia glomerata]